MIWSSTEYTQLSFDSERRSFAWYAYDTLEVDDPDEVVGRWSAGSNNGHVSSPIKVPSWLSMAVRVDSRDCRASAASQKEADATAWEESHL